jgi:F0F1-type ATP synthase assembly protein I
LGIRRSEDCGDVGLLSGNKQSPAWLRSAGVGFELVASVVGFTLLGYWLERQFDWKPWGVLGGALVGIVGGLYNLVKTGLSAGREAEAEDRAAKVAADARDSGSSAEDDSR